jgi:hypothetical protein
MRLSMAARRELTKLKAKQYRKENKKGKTGILNGFVETTGYTRKYAIHLLSNWGKEKIIKIYGKPVRVIIGARKKKVKRNRPRKYDDDVKKALKKVWYIYDCICGKRLAPVLRTMLSILYKFKEVDFSLEVREKLESISAATIDRLLSSEKKKIKIKGLSHTRSGNLLKHGIPVRTFNDWNEKRPGFVEGDLVGHDGGNGSGDFCFTLNVTDVCTQWTEPIAIKNKAQKWAFEGLMRVKNRIPFAMLGIDSDNGSEFINKHLMRYCIQNNITFTRSRPYRKNDNCYVEQKNNTIVRRYVGYFRHDTEEELEILNQIYRVVRLLVNFFYPSQKLIFKTRIGSKVKKKYDVPKTPYMRLIEYAYISQEIKNNLKDQFEQLNPVILQKKLVRLQEKLWRCNKQKQIQDKAECS